MDPMLNHWGFMGPQVQTILSALAVFIIGWIVALIASSAMRKLLTGMHVNRRLNDSTGKPHDLERLGSRLLFWFILIIAIVGALSLLNLQVISGPFASMVQVILDFVPRLIAAAILGGIGWIVAVAVRTALTTVLHSTTLDSRLSAKAGMAPVSHNIGQIAYSLILLMFLPMVLSALGLNGLLVPVQGMLSNLLAFIPNVFAAAIIGVVGYIVAKIVRGIVESALATSNVQGLAQKSGIKAETNLPSLAGKIVFALILLPTIITALDALKIDAISRPAVHMLDQIMQAIPNIIVAALILGITWYVARFVGKLISGLLESAGVNALPACVGMQDALGTKRLSDVVGHILVFFAMLFATIEAANRLGFGRISDILAMFINFGASIILGAVILCIGFWLANLLGSAVQRTNHGHANWLGTLVRVLIMGLVLAMGLQAMGIADSIVNLAFGLTLGSVAVAFAIAFGLGGREPAQKLLYKLMDKAEKNAVNTQKPASVLPTPPVTPVVNLPVEPVVSSKGATSDLYTPEDLLARIKPRDLEL